MLITHVILLNYEFRLCSVEIFFNAAYFVALYKQ